MLVSVIVPVYNAGVYLEKCINSILGQTLRDFELILCDDGSTDGSGAICDEYAARDPRIQVIHQKNGGSSAARNAGIRKASGEFFSFIDSDDYVEPDFLETLLKPVIREREKENNEPLIVQVGRNEIDSSGERLPDICVPPETETFISSEEFMKSLLLHVGDCSMCTKLTDRRLFNGREFPVGKLNEDFKVLIYMLLDCKGVISLPCYKYNVFYKPESNTRKKNKNDFSRVFLDNVNNADEADQLVKCIYPSLKKISVRFGLFQRLTYLLHIPIDFMRKDYEGYEDVVKYVRKNWLRGMFSPYLSGKSKRYLTLFAVAPKIVRKVHAKIKKL